MQDVLLHKLVTTPGDFLYTALVADVWQLHRLPSRAEAERLVCEMDRRLAREAETGVIVGEGDEAEYEAEVAAQQLAAHSLTVRRWLARGLADGKYTADERLAYAVARDALAAHLQPADEDEEAGDDAEVVVNNFQFELLSSTQLWQFDQAAVARSLRRRGIAAHTDSDAKAFARPVPAYVSRRVVGAFRVGRVLTIDRMLDRAQVFLDIGWVSALELCVKHGR